MSDSLTEIVVERFYRSKGYLVERCVPMVGDDGPRFWSDLDLLAIRDEVLLVNCKDFVSDPKQKGKIVKNLSDAMKWVQRNYKDLVGTKPIRQILVCGGSDKATIQHLDEAGIKCLHFDDVLAR